jgi:hypothetical protein
MKTLLGRSGRAFGSWSAIPGHFRDRVVIRMLEFASRERCPTVDERTRKVFDGENDYLPLMLDSKDFRKGESFATRSRNAALYFA